jgi:hypothetical protein
MFSKASNTFAPIAITVAGAVSALLSLSAAAAPGTPVGPTLAGPPDVMFFSAAEGGCPPAPQFEARGALLDPLAGAVKNAPYSGVGTTEVVKELADGNRIVRKNTMRYYRDGSGRTRTEYSLGAIGPFTPDRTQTLVTINDPVAGQRYVLNSALKRADVLKLGGSGSAGGEARAGFFVRHLEAGQVAGGVFGSDGPVTDVATALPPLPPLPPVAVTSGSLEAPPGNVTFTLRAAPAAGIAGCRMETKPLPAALSLGERTIEGLKVTGSRREFNIEAGAVGNEQPMTVSTEQWFSAELGVVVASTHRDPMIGDTSYKLTQISRAEPDASLFKVPADYTKQEVPGPSIHIQTFEAPPPR